MMLLKYVEIFLNLTVRSNELGMCKSCFWLILIKILYLSQTCSYSLQVEINYSVKCVLVLKLACLYEDSLCPRLSVLWEAKATACHSLALLFTLHVLSTVSKHVNVNGW